jgi:DNA primase
MAIYLPQELIEEIKARVSIREVVSDYLSLTKDGANYKALCPFHKEKTPSFKVHEGKAIFHCFGCGESGNIFTFLMKMEGISFPEAVDRLAKRAGVELPKPERGPKTKEQDENARLFRVNELAQEFYQEKLYSPEGKKALEYLHSRGMDDDRARRFGLGYAPAGWDNLIKHLEGRGVPRNLILAAGLIIPREGGEGHYDRFRDRVIFPIRDLLARVRGFGARYMDEALKDTQPKYINSPETPVYKKGEMLYGLDLAKDAIRKKDRAIIVEGYFDRISLALFGFDEAVASLGTAFTDAQAHIVSRYTRNIYLVFDSDEAGRKAGFRALPIFLSAGQMPFLVSMPEGFDPDDMVRKQGGEAFEKLLAHAPRLLDHYLELQIGLAGSDLAKKGEKVRELVSMISYMPNALDRELYLKKLAELSGVSAGQLQKIMLKERVSGPEERETIESKTASPANWLAAEEIILSCLVSHPEPGLAQIMIDEKVSEKISDPPLAQYIARLSEEIISRGKCDPSDFFHLLNGTKWERVVGKALSETGPYQDDKLVQAVRESLAVLKKRAIEQKDQELTQKINLAKQQGNEELIRELLTEKNQLIRLKREQSAGRVA